MIQGDPVLQPNKVKLPSTLNQRDEFPQNNKHGGILLKPIGETFQSNYSALENKKSSLNHIN